MVVSLPISANLAAKRSLPAHSPWYLAAMEQLVSVVQQLSQAHELDAITAIVRDAARSLTRADGATFVLRDGDCCFYADENAISPLWKGLRFPMSHCISGWVMLNAKPALIPDIYADPRIPQDAYRPTFVRSLLMVPIRTQSPIGAIGNYWASPHEPSEEEVAILQALADTASVAIENAQLYMQLASKVDALQESNYELNRFAWVASHDLQEPLRTITTQVELLEMRYGDQLDERGRGYIHTAVESTQRLQSLIEALLVHAQVEKVEDFGDVDMQDVVDGVLQDLHILIGETQAELQVGEMPLVRGNASLLSRVVQNLISNAVKFQPAGQKPCVRIVSERRGKEWVCSVHDNGIGIDEAYHQRIFGLFQRLHAKNHYMGSGIGLATCKKIIEMHRGRIWIESAPGEGSSFYFTLPGN